MNTSLIEREVVSLLADNLTAANMPISASALRSDVFDVRFLAGGGSVAPVLILWLRGAATFVMLSSHGLPVMEQALQGFCRNVLSLPLSPRLIVAWRNPQAELPLALP